MNTNCSIILLTVILLFTHCKNEKQPSSDIRSWELNREHAKLVSKTNQSVADAALKAEQDPLKPLFHVQPPAYWMNDPNGPIFFNGKYHLFFQHNPYGDEWGNMSWGHVVSEDLVHWERLPIALTPNPDSYDKDGVFSGCCVVYDSLPTIIYTGVWPEVQCLAQSDEDMITWFKHPQNPVIAERPRDDLEGFRDPFVWKEGELWYMVIGSGIKGEGGTALLYKSRDLVEWEYMHPLCTGFGFNWECPIFFPLGDKWVLVVSPHGDVKYAIGDYSEYRFRPGEWQRMDFGGQSGFYAPNCLLDANGRRIMWGWISGGGTTGYPWNGMLTLPRVLTLRADGRLDMAPLPELKALRGKHWSYKNFTLTPDTTHILKDAHGTCLEILAEIDPGNAAAVTIEVLRSPDGAEKTAIIYDTQNLRLISGDHSGDFQLLPGEQYLTLHIFIDRSVVEVFANDRACLTIRTYPKGEDSTGINLMCQKRPAKIVSLDVWEMGSIWE